MDFFEIRKPVRKIGLDQYIIGSDPSNPLVLIDGSKLDVDALSVKELTFETGLFERIRGEYHEYISGHNENLSVDNLIIKKSTFSEISGYTGIFSSIVIDGQDIEDKLEELEDSILNIDFSSGIVISGHVTASNDAAQFCKAFASGDQYLSNSSELNIDFNGDLSKGSYDWRSINVNTTKNIFTVEDAGYYDIDFSWKYHSGENVGEVLSANSLVYKINKLNQQQEVLGTDVKFKTDAEFIEEYSGAYSSPLNPVINIKNVFLTEDEELYAIASHYSADTGKLYKISTEEFDTYLNLEKKTAAASGAFTFEDLLDTPENIGDGAGKYLKVNNEGTSIEFTEVIQASGNIFAKKSINSTQYLNNASGIILDFDGPLASGSSDWSYSDNQINTLKVNDAGFYDIDFEWSYEDSQDLGSILKSSSNLYKKNLNNNNITYLGSDIRFKQDNELIEEYREVYSGQLKPKVNIKNVYLNTDEYIIAEIEHHSTNTGLFSISTNIEDTYLNLQRKVNTAGASNFVDLLDTPLSLISGSGKFLKVSDDESSIVFSNTIDTISGGTTTNTTGSINRYELKEAFELDENGDVVPSNAEQISDNMWILRNENDLEIRANLWRYNTGPEAFTDDISF